MNKKLKQMENKTILIWKIAIASALSWEAAKLAGSDHPYLAPLSVILCLQTTVIQSIQYSYHRMVGTVIGIAVTMFAAPYVGVNGWTIGLLILIGCVITKLLKRDESALHQVALTVLLVFVMEHKSGDYFIDRFRDTLIGAFTAVMINMLFYPPNFTKQASQSLNNLARHLVSNYTKVSDWCRLGMKKNEGQVIQKDINTLLQELHQTKTLLKAASDSLVYNPFGKNSKNKLRRLQLRLDVLTLGYTYLTSVIETMINWTSEEKVPAIQQSQWAHQFKALISFFDENEKTPGRTHEHIQIDLPLDLQRQQYFISLYHQTSQLVKQLTKTVWNLEKK